MCKSSIVNAVDRFTEHVDGLPLVRESRLVSTKLHAVKSARSGVPFHCRPNDITFVYERKMSRDM